MKKLFFMILAGMFFGAQLFAAPVDVNTAKNLGVKYLKNNVLSAKSITDAQHAYTLTSDEGTPYLYVFNHENGYVVVAADDRAYPILGYGEGGAMDVNNMPEGLRYYLGYYGSQIQYAIDNELVAEQDVVEQWELLRKEGVTTKTRMDKAVSPLLQTTWDQGWPYNYYAPACQSYWTNNHCYAGCVATAMSQNMKFWNWPETGVGEHSYSTSTYGGTLTANFGETTYNWSIMPNQLGSTANAAAQAVALLMYHCGIAVDMNYKPDGSGAYSEDVPSAVIQYFRYGTCTYLDYRDAYSRTEWEDLLMACLDRGIPLFYAGSDNSGGHAFNCDGYNNQRYFNFNFGWSGSYNNYYQIDALNTGNGTFNQNQKAVFDMIPDYIYNAMVPEINTLKAFTDDAVTKTVNVEFTVPETSASGAALTSVEKIEIKRNGTVIKTYENLQPGEQLAFTDEVAEYGNYEYIIVGTNYGIIGKSFKQMAIVGPRCTWKITCTTTNFQGWNGGVLSFVDADGLVFKTVTMTSSSPTSDKFALAEGNFTLKWKAPSTTVSAMTITLKNSANQAVYNFSGSSSQLTETLYSGNNDCEGCTAPTGFAGQYAYVDGLDGTMLTWNCSYNPSKFKVYRSEDGVAYNEIAAIDGTLNEYFDGVNVMGAYYYKVTAYSTACESTPALTADNTEYVMIEVLSVPENSIEARVYPNPTSGKLNIQAEALEKVVVFNLVGQKVYEENISGDEYVIDMNRFGCGIYMIKITSSKGSTTKKITVLE